MTLQPQQEMQCTQEQNDNVDSSVYNMDHALSSPPPPPQQQYPVVVSDADEDDECMASDLERESIHDNDDDSDDDDDDNFAKLRKNRSGSSLSLSSPKNVDHSFGTTDSKLSSGEDDEDIYTLNQQHAEIVNDGLEEFSKDVCDAVVEGSNVDEQNGEEGSFPATPIKDDDGDDDDDDDISDEFQREMNKTKIAFFAYKQAILHLVQNVNHVSSPAEDDNHHPVEEETFHNNDEFETPQQEQNGIANHVDRLAEKEAHRIILEYEARTVLETKARTCVDAVQVANEWKARRRRREEDQHRRLEEALFQMTKESLKKEAEEFERRRKLRQMRSQLLKGGLIGRQSLFSDIIQKGNGNSSTLFELKQVENKYEVKDEAKSLNNDVKNASSATRRDEAPIKTKKKIVKKGRSPDCKKHMFPKFEYQPSRTIKTEDGNEDDDPEQQQWAQYRTTLWIREMTKWRTLRRTFIIENLTKCGCTDCLEDMTRLDFVVKEIE